MRIRMIADCFYVSFFPEYTQPIKAGKRVCQNKMSFPSCQSVQDDIACWWRNSILTSPWLSKIFFLLSLFICTSCNDEEPSVVDKYPYYFAYFEGELNGQSISLLNQSSYQCSIERGNFWIHDIEKELYGFYWKVPLKSI